MAAGFFFEENRLFTCRLYPVLAVGFGAMRSTPTYSQGFCAFSQNRFLPWALQIPIWRSIVYYITSVFHTSCALDG